MNAKKKKEQGVDEIHAHTHKHKTTTHEHWMHSKAHMHNNQQAVKKKIRQTDRPTNTFRAEIRTQIHPRTEREGENADKAR